jgi:hypothetical protein
VTLTAPATAPTRVQTVNAAKLSADNIGDRIQFSQDNGWRGGILTVNGTVTGASQYRPMFEMARIEVDGELYAVRYETPVTLERAAGRPPMLHADYVPPAIARPVAPVPAELRTVLSSVVAAAALPSRIGWTAEVTTEDGPLAGVVTEAYRDGEVIVARIADLWGELSLTEPVVLSRQTADEAADIE